MDELFGAQVVLTHLCNINTCRYFIFNLPYTLDTWDAFTYGYQDTSPFPTYLYEQYSSKFSFTPGECPGGQNPNPEPPNTAFVCIPSLDTALSAAVNATSETSFDNLMVTGANSAFNILGRSAVVLPAYTFSVRTPALRSVDGLTNARGVGYETTQEELSAHKGPYVPVDPRYAFDGGGSSDALRWGQASPIDFLNPYQAGTVWEANTLFSVYDTLFATNPVAPNQVYCNMCQTVTPSVVGGNQEFTVTLRQNLRWQDGVPVDAFDIKFSLLTLRDEASNFSGGLLELLDVQVLSSSTLTITMRGQSVSHLLDLASPPIIPRHLWECPPNGQSAVSASDPATHPSMVTLERLTPAKWILATILLPAARGS